MAKVFQVQAKDSVVKLGPFDTINAIQDLNLDPRFNEEYYSELGNINYTAQSRQPETSGSFSLTSTGALASILARMKYDYSSQAYTFDPVLKGNAYSFSEADFEFCIFDLINSKQPGLVFTNAALVPAAQLTGITIRVDSTGSATESLTFEGQIQEEYYKPYHDIIAVPLTTLTSGTAQIPAAFSATVNSGTYGILYVGKDTNRFFGSYSGPYIPTPSNAATFTTSTVITVPTALFQTSAPFDRVVAYLYKLVPGTFPTIYYPTSARFVRGDRADVWMIGSGTSFSDGNRTLRVQSVDINLPIRRTKLTEVKRNSDLNTIYYRTVDYPLQFTATATLNEVDLQQWASLQNKTLNNAAATTPIDSSNLVDLVDFTGLRLVVRYWVAGNDTTPLCEMRIDDASVTGWSERQRVGTHAERTLNLTGSKFNIVGNLA